MRRFTTRQLEAFIFFFAIVVCVVSSSVSNQTIDDVSNATPADDEEAERQRLLNTAREASAKLRSYLRGVRVAKEQIAPLTSRNDSQPTVTLRTIVKVMSILEVNDVQQTVKISLYLQLVWRDYALTWNESDHNGVSRIQLDSESIWKPHLYVANSMDLKNLMAETKIISLSSDGTVEADIPVLLETTCPMDLTRYPFDAQTCTIKIVSYSALKWEIYEKNYDESLAESLAFSTEWHLTEVSTRFFSLKGELHPEVVLLLRRKTTFYTVCLVLPMVLTSYMNALVFLVPLQSGEKVSFLVTIFVSNSVYIGFFSSMMPRGLDSVPNSMVLLVGVMVESLLVLLATLFVLRRFHGEQENRRCSETPDDITYRWNEDSRRSSEMANEGVKFACLSGDQWIDEMEPSHRGWVSTNPKRCITTSEREQGLTTFPKSRIHTGTYFPSRSPLAFAQAPKSNKPASRLNFSMKAHQLDWIMFAVAFVANTIFLGALYASSLE